MNRLRKVRHPTDKFGYFFALRVPNISTKITQDAHFLGHSRYLDNGLTIATTYSTSMFTRHTYRKCTRSARHSGCFWLKVVPDTVCVHEGEGPAEFVIETFGHVGLVDEKYAIRLADRFQSVMAKRVYPDADKSEVPKGLTFCNLEYTGEAFFRPCEVSCGSGKCPFCGKADVVCSECGEVDWLCSVCAEECAAPPLIHHGESDPRYVIDVSDSDVILGRTWNGGDFIGLNELVVTSTVIEFLESTHGGPILYRPIPVDVTGMSDKQLHWLSRIRRR